MSDSTSFTIGKVTGVHGLAGYLKVWSYAESVETFSQGRLVLLKLEEKEDQSFRIKRAALHKKGILLSLEGIEDRDHAEALVGAMIVIHRDQIPEPEEDTWYWQDLIGLDVIDVQHGCIGVITDIFPTGAHDVLVVTREEDGKKMETLVPMHKHFVTRVDIEKHLVNTRLPEGYP